MEVRESGGEGKWREGKWREGIQSRSLRRGRRGRRGSGGEGKWKEGKWR